MKKAIFGIVFLIGLVTQASSLAGVEAELGGSVLQQADARRSTRPLFLNSYREDSRYEEETVRAGSNQRQLAVNRAPGYLDEEPYRLSAQSSYHSEPIYGITPTIGTMWWGGGWGPYITNQYALGLLVDFPLSRSVSLEIEGAYANNRINYISPGGYGHHTFDQFMAGGNGKVYLWRGVINPYVGAGITGIYYSGMRGVQMGYPGIQQYNQLVGSGQLLVGSEVGVSENITLGARGSWLLPLINRPLNQDYPGGPTGRTASPGFEEAAAINTSFFRLVGTVRVTF